MKDLYKKYTLKGNEWVSVQICECAVASGMKKDDTLAALEHNCLEWTEFYAAVAKDSFIIVAAAFAFSGPKREHINHNGVVWSKTQPE